mmetsp:Transcript_10242/g.15474  ORF Transcript_10242/g.15474 Transcript_10242/m.15474 type:complete len:613 (+) Transcript_10242:88-1926(+)
MLAAHFPTARSRCDLDHMIKSSSSRNLLRRNGSYSSSSSGGSITSSSTLRHRGSKKKRESVHLNEDEKKHHHHHPEEARAYAAVSLLYALGQSLYDIFSSQQAKSSTLRFKNAYLAAYAYAILVSAYPMAKALSSPYVGHLSDKIGRKSVLVATLVATGLCLACCGSAESYWGVLVARFATGCVANGGLLTARATDIAADHAQRTRLFSLFTTAWAIARVGAAVLVRLLTLDVARACKFAAWCEIAAAVIALIGFRGIYPREIDTKQKQTLPTANKPSFRNLAREMLSERLALCLFATSMLTPRVDATAFVSRRFGDEGLAQSVGYLKAVEAVAVVTVGLTPVSKRLSKFFGEAGAAVLAALAVALGWIGVAYAPNILALYILVAIRAACAAVYDPAARSLVWARAADRKDKTPGSVAGLQQSLKGATQVFSSWLGAYLTTLSVSAPLAISAVAMVANALSVAFVEKRHPLSNSPNNKHHQQQQQQRSPHGVIHHDPEWNAAIAAAVIASTPTGIAAQRKLEKRHQQHYHRPAQQLVETQQPRVDQQQPHIFTGTRSLDYNTIPTAFPDQQQRPVDVVPQYPEYGQPIPPQYTDPRVWGNYQPPPPGPSRVD